MVPWVLHPVSVKMDLAQSMEYTPRGKRGTGLGSAGGDSHWEHEGGATWTPVSRGQGPAVRAEVLELGTQTPAAPRARQPPEMSEEGARERRHL